MSLYAVAYTNFFDNDLKIEIIEASEAVEAISLVYPKLTCYEDDSEWLKKLIQTVIQSQPSDVIEKIRCEFFNSDQLIAVKEITKIT